MSQVEFEWDDANEEHVAGHEVEPEEAEEALRDSLRTGAPSYSVPAEQRRAFLGRTEDGRLLYVVTTRRRGAVRVVTARDATPDEYRLYRRRNRSRL
jgi:uncharacterized protein